MYYYDIYYVLQCIIDILLYITVYQTEGLSYKQMEVLSASSVFMFPHMLPERRFVADALGEKRVRVYFSESEDM